MRLPPSTLLPPPGQPLPTLEGEASAQDLGQLYLAILGREAEPQLLRKPPQRPLHDIADEMLRSDEFNYHVLQAVVQQRSLPHDKLSEQQRHTLGQWLTERAGCAPLPAELAQPDGPAQPQPDAEPPCPAELLLRLVSHPALAPVLYLAHGSLLTQALEDLSTLLRAGQLRLKGKIEFVNREFIQGWVVDASGRRPQLQVEVRNNGRLVAAASAHSYRPDIHQLYGGSGMAGFRAKYNPTLFPPGQPVCFTLHEASSGVMVGPAYTFGNSFYDQLSVAQMLAKEFADIKHRLDVLAGMVPQALSYSAFPLEHFDLYRQTHRVPPPPWLLAEHAPGARPLRRPPQRFTVLLDATQSRSATGVRISIDTLRHQAGSVPWQAWVVGQEPDVADVCAVLAAVHPQVRHQPNWAHAQQELARLAQDPKQWTLLLRAGELLDPHALAWLLAETQAQQPPTEPDAAAPTTTAPVALYWDEDRLEHRTGHAPHRAPRHVAPVLRAPFCPDALLELNVLGTSFAVQAQALLAATHLLAAHPLTPVSPEQPPVRPELVEGPATHLHPLCLQERERLAWALHAQGPLHHVPQWLLTRTHEALDIDPDKPTDVDHPRLVAQASPEALQALLPAAWQTQRWQRVPDPVAPQLPKPLVRWQPQRPQAILSVLIPTRDHWQLVQQCVESLYAQALHPEALDIVVADNGSTEPETLAYLAQAQAAGRLRCLRMDAPFNWSQLNNRMAAAARGELLLILNNDTLMLTPQWDDILRGQLERPHVGAVGARLLFEDMTLQHAGIQFGYENFVGHVAAEQPPDDAMALFETQLTHAVSGATGAFLGCRREVFEATGGFNEADFGVTFNDVDWCIRVRELGLAVLYVPLLSMVHYESKSRGFDFMNERKQKRAEHERDQILQRYPRHFFTDDARSPLLSGWSGAGRALR
ncbi:MAG: glycosyltransferase [Ideonella sp.]|nr:glycosyltransferase [Ideonella sp.]